MKTVTNKTRKPLKIRVGSGKFLHLGPLKSASVSDQAAEEEALRKLVAAGEVEIQGEGGVPPSGGSSSDAVHEATHGHPPKTMVLPKGNR